MGKGSSLVDLGIVEHTMCHENNELMNQIPIQDLWKHCATSCVVTLVAAEYFAIRFLMNRSRHGMAMEMASMICVPTLVNGLLCPNVGEWSDKCATTDNDEDESS